MPGMSRKVDCSVFADSSPPYCGCHSLRYNRESDVSERSARFVVLFPQPISACSSVDFSSPPATDFKSSLDEGNLGRFGVRRLPAEPLRR